MYNVADNMLTLPLESYLVFHYLYCFVCRNPGHYIFTWRIHVRTVSLYKDKKTRCGIITTYPPPPPTQLAPDLVLNYLRLDLVLNYVRSQASIICNVMF